MTSYIVATPEAQIKHLRQLADALEEVSSAHISDLLPLVRAVEQYGSVSSISSADAKRLCETLMLALESDRASIITLTLRLVIQVARSLPPSYLALYCHPLTQKTCGLLSTPHVTLRPCVMTAVASLVAAVAPLISQGGSHKAQGVLVCQRALRAALSAFQASKSTISAAIAIPALSVILAVIHSAPRELRATLAHVEKLLRTQLFIHDSPAVRRSAAIVFSQLGISCPDRLRPASFTARLAGMCAELDDILIFLRMFSPDPLKTHNVSASILTLPSAEVAYLSYSLCEAISASLSSQMPPPTPIPLPTILSTLTAALAPPSIDPYAASPAQARMDADGALLVASTISSAAARTLNTVFRFIPRDILLPHAAMLSRRLRDQISVLIMQSTSEEAHLATVEGRQILYNSIVSAMPVLGGVLLNAVLPTLRHLLAIDISLRVRISQVPNPTCPSSTFSQNIALAPLRKRRKLEKMDSTGGKVDDAAVAKELAKFMDSSAVHRIHTVFRCAMDVCTAVFSARGFLSKAAANAMAEVELLLSRCLEENIFNDGILEAVAAAVAGGGSNLNRALSCPLLEQCIRVSSMLINRSGIEPDVRISAFSVRAACEGLVHPRGPPMNDISKKVLAQRTTQQTISNRHGEDKNAPHVRESPFHGTANVASGVNGSEGNVDGSVLGSNATFPKPGTLGALNAANGAPLPATVPQISPEADAVARGNRPTIPVEPLPNNGNNNEATPATFADVAGGISVRPQLESEHQEDVPRSDPGRVDARGNEINDGAMAHAVAGHDALPAKRVNQDTTSFNEMGDGSSDVKSQPVPNNNSTIVDDKNTENGTEAEDVWTEKEIEARSTTLEENVEMTLVEINTCSELEKPDTLRKDDGAGKEEKEDEKNEQRSAGEEDMGDGDVEQNDSAEEQQLIDSLCFEQSDEELTGEHA